MFQRGTKKSNQTPKSFFLFSFSLLIQNSGAPDAPFLLKSNKFYLYSGLKNNNS